MYAWQTTTYYAEPWPRLPRKTKKLVDSEVCAIVGKRRNPRRKTNRDRKRWAAYMDRKVKQ